MLEMNSTTVGLTTSAKDVRASRTFQLELDELSYTVRMVPSVTSSSITFGNPVDKRDDSRSPAGTDLRSGGPGLPSPQSSRGARSHYPRRSRTDLGKLRGIGTEPACSLRFSCARDTTAGVILTRRSGTAGVTA